MTRRRRARDFLLGTCEHGGNRVTARYAVLFRGRRRKLHSHRGYDAGALLMARAFRAPLAASTITRLLVELNRSPWNHRLFSEATRELPAHKREHIVASNYAPYRNEVETRVARAATIRTPASPTASRRICGAASGRAGTSASSSR